MSKILLNHVYRRQLIQPDPDTELSALMLGTEALRRLLDWNRCQDKFSMCLDLKIVGILATFAAYKNVKSALLSRMDEDLVPLVWSQIQKQCRVDDEREIKEENEFFESILFCDRDRLSCGEDAQLWAYEHYGPYLGRGWRNFLCRASGYEV